jgi:hypothetical protein
MICERQLSDRSTSYWSSRVQVTSFRKILASPVVRRATSTFSNAVLIVSSLKFYAVCDSIASVITLDVLQNVSLYLKIVKAVSATSDLICSTDIRLRIAGRSSV